MTDSGDLIERLLNRHESCQLQIVKEDGEYVAELWFYDAVPQPDAYTGRGATPWDALRGVCRDADDDPVPDAS